MFHKHLKYSQSAGRKSYLLWCFDAPQIEKQKVLENKEMSEKVDKAKITITLSYLRLREPSKHTVKYGVCLIIIVSFDCRFPDES